MHKVIRGAAPLMIMAIAIGSLAGCAGSKQSEVETDMEQLLAQRDEQIQELSDTLENQSAKIEDLEGELMTAKQAHEQAYSEMELMRNADAQGMAGDDLLPPASPGECYTRVFVPAAYEQVSEEVLHKEATSTVATVPAEYEWVEEQVMVSASSFKLETVPARYEWREEQVLVREAHTVWKRGRGPIEKIDESTGEIVCLVEVPAEYKTVRTQVEVAAATTKRVEIPAQYETIKVRKLVNEASERRTQVPAEYQTVTRWVRTSEAHMEWREIICETNMGTDLVRRLQVALRDAGHDPGPIDGIHGRLTQAAIISYQKANSLAVGGITYETVERLGL